MLVDVPQLELASITLCHGTVLPEHASLMSISIQAVSGSGTIGVLALRHWAQS